MIVCTKLPPPPDPPPPLPHPLPPHLPPPPPTGGAASALLLCTAQSTRRMPRCTFAYPPYRALPPPSPYRMGQRGMQPLPRGRRLAWEQHMRRCVARSDPHRPSAASLPR